MPAYTNSGPDEYYGKGHDSREEFTGGKEDVKRAHGEYTIGTPNYSNWSNYMDEEKKFGQQVMADAATGNTSVAQQQLRQGLAQNQQMMAAQSVGRGSSPLAQRAAIYGGGQAGQQMVGQSAALRAAEMQAAQQMYGGMLQRQTGAGWGMAEQDLQRQIAQAQHHAQMYGLEQEQAKEDKGLLGGAIGGAAGSFFGALSSENMKDIKSHDLTDKEFKYEQGEVEKKDTMGEAVQMAGAVASMMSDEQIKLINRGRWTDGEMAAAYAADKLVHGDKVRDLRFSSSADYGPGTRDWHDPSTVDAYSSTDKFEREHRYGSRFEGSDADREAARIAAELGSGDFSEMQSRADRPRGNDYPNERRPYMGYHVDEVVRDNVPGPEERGSYDDQDYYRLPAIGSTWGDKSDHEAARSERGARGQEDFIGWEPSPKVENKETDTKKFDKKRKSKDPLEEILGDPDLSKYERAQLEMKLKDRREREEQKKWDAILSGVELVTDSMQGSPSRYSGPQSYDVPSGTRDLAAMSDERAKKIAYNQGVKDTVGDLGVLAPHGLEERNTKPVAAEKGIGGVKRKFDRAMLDSALAGAGREKGRNWYPPEPGDRREWEFAELGDKVYERGEYSRKPPERISSAEASDVYLPEDTLLGSDEKAKEMFKEGLRIGAQASEDPDPRWQESVSSLRRWGVRAPQPPVDAWGAATLKKKGRKIDEASLPLRTGVRAALTEAGIPGYQDAAQSGIRDAAGVVERGDGSHWENLSDEERVAWLKRIKSEGRSAGFGGSDEAIKSIPDSGWASHGSGVDPAVREFYQKTPVFQYEYNKEAQQKFGMEPGKRVGTGAHAVDRAGPIGDSISRTHPSGVQGLDTDRGTGAALGLSALANRREDAAEMRDEMMQKKLATMEAQLQAMQQRQMTSALARKLGGR